MNHPDRIIILANGDLINRDYVQSQLKPDDMIIAANGGTRLAFALNIIPSMVIGDRDSLPTHLQEWLLTHKIPHKQHPPEKDETDLELAIYYAIEKKPQKILFLGLTGSRTDHMLANFSLLVIVAHHNIQAEVIVNQEHIYAVTEDLILRGQPGDTLSILPWGGDALGVSTEGTKWKLQDATLPFGPARGISNIMVQAQVEIRIKQGLILVVHQRGNFL